MVVYSKEFKEQAIRLSDEIGNKKAAEELGIPYYTLSDWRARNKRKEKEMATSVEGVLRARIQELEMENTELREVNHALKNAILFFAKEQKKK